MSQDFLAIELTPRFIEGNKGPLFCLSFLPPDKSGEIILFLPPFAEELNRCRVMVAMQARQLATKGIGTLLLDYYGTGDSAGDFAETTWAQWQQDIQSAIAWLRHQGYENISLWGMRLGALLAAYIASQSPSSFGRLLLWQPIVDGNKYLTQFLRIRLTFLMERGQTNETTQLIKSALEQYGKTEIAGYELSAQLFHELDAMQLNKLNQLAGLEIHWFEWVMEETAEPSPASQKIIQAWRQQNNNIIVHPYTGPLFWQAHERELNPLLLSITTSQFS